MNKKIAIHTVFIAKENILFLIEWILYHKLKGVDDFILYDNTGIQYKGYPDFDTDNNLIIPNKKNNRGINYDKLINLTQKEVSSILEYIQKSIPGVFVIKWQPKNDSGQIVYNQVEAHNDARRKYACNYDWIISVDVDEFLVSKEPLKNIIDKKLEENNLKGGVIYQIPMVSRFNYFDRYTTEINLALDRQYYDERIAPKYIYNPKIVKNVGVHYFESKEKERYYFPKNELFFYHYKRMENEGRVSPTPTKINPKILSEIKSSAMNYCKPEWRKKVINKKYSEEIKIQKNKKYQVGLIVIATSKYIEFFPNLLKTIQNFFLVNHNVKIFLFTDQIFDKSLPQSVQQIKIEHQKWPFITLKRYELINQHENLFKTLDYLFYCDVDMLMVDIIKDQDVFPSEKEKLVAVRHPGFYSKFIITPKTRFDNFLRKNKLPYRKFYKKSRGTYEINPQSTAYVKQEEGEIYYAGGFNGGITKHFLKMAKILADNIQQDLRKNIIAVWNDESHLNRYLIDNPPKTLTPSYCYPETKQLPFDKKILCLDKNHSKFQV